jgi:hypothetical protein
MKSSLIILLFFVNSGLYAQNGNINLSRWHNNDNTELSYYQSVKNNRLFYYISNDNDNIYIDLKIVNPETQIMILKEGLIIWVDMDNKSLKKLGVRYPLGSENQGRYNKTGQSEGVKNQEADVSSLLKMANTIELIGFISEQERRFPSQNADNFRGSVRYEGGILFYRMLMPIAKLPVRNSRDGNGAMPFTLCVEYGFPPETKKPDGKMKPGRKASDNQTVIGSEIYCIKNVKLATSK